MRYAVAWMIAVVFVAVWLTCQGCKRVDSSESEANQRLCYFTATMMRMPTARAESLLLAFEKEVGPEWDRLDKNQRVIALNMLGIQFFWEHEYAKSFQYRARALEYSGKRPDDHLVYVAGLADRTEWLAKEIAACGKEDFLLKQALIVSLAWAKGDYRGAIAAADVPIPKGIPIEAISEEQLPFLNLICFMKTRALAQLGEYRAAQVQFDSVNRKAFMTTVPMREFGLFAHMCLVYAEIADKLGELERVEPILPYLGQLLDMTPHKDGVRMCLQRDWDTLQDIKRRLARPSPASAPAVEPATKPVDGAKEPPPHTR